MLLLLMVIFAVNFLDRMALGMTLQNIKADLGLSDTQLGLLTGFASAFFFAVAGIPIARWADRGDRVMIIGLMIILQCIAVALFGLAGSFLQLVLLRVVVSAGEAGCVPPAQSLIVDYFRRAERPRAIARYMLGLPLSMVLGYFVAGWLNELYGWRTTFVILGLPGLGLAVLAWFTLHEPRRACAAGVGRGAPQAYTPPESPSAPAPSLISVCATLWANVTYRHLLVSYSLWIFFGAAIGKWQPTFFIRSHGFETGELGTWLAVVWGVGGGLGIYFGGMWATRYAAENENLQLRVCTGACVVAAVLNVCVYLTPNRYTAFGALALEVFAVSMVKGPMFGTIHTLVPAHMRAVALAILFLAANLIGAGIGPLAVGALSDALLPRFGLDALRYALVLLCPGYFWAAWHLWRASRTVAGDIAVTQTASALVRPAVEHGVEREKLHPAATN